MNDHLPPSLNRFAAELEQAICRELGRRRDHRLVRLLRARPRLLAGTTIGAAGTGAVLAIVLIAAGSSPAFAVTRNHDGTVSVALMRSAGIVGANAKLSALGVRAKIVQQTVGCGSVITQVPSGSTTPVSVVTSGGSSAYARIDPRKIPAGKTLVIAARGTGPMVNIVAAASTVTGAAPACLPPPISAAQQQSFLANAQCMREQGLRNFPDPTFPAAGGIAFNVPNGSLAYEATAILQASKACTNVGTPLPDGALAGPFGGSSGNSGNSGSGDSLPPPISAAQQQSFLANAHCMREQGVPNFPDPTFPAAGGISFDVPAGSLAYEANAILQASKACANVGTPLPDGALAGPFGGSSGNSSNSSSGNSGSSSGTAA